MASPPSRARVKSPARLISAVSRVYSRRLVGHICRGVSLLKQDEFKMKTTSNNTQDSQSVSQIRKDSLARKENTGEGSSLSLSFVIIRSAAVRLSSETHDQRMITLACCSPTPAQHSYGQAT